MTANNSRSTTTPPPKKKKGVALNAITFWGHLNPFVYSDPIGNEEEIHQRVSDACNNSRNPTGTYESVRPSFIWRVLACVGSWGIYFEHSIL